MKSFKNLLLITLGTFIVSLGITFFLIPAKLASGGVTGLAIVIQSVLPNIPIGAILLVLNVLLYIIGFIAIGPDFGAKTIYASFLLTGLISVLDAVFKLSGPLVQDPIVNLIMGVLISGVGLGIVFNQNASTGGTDIIAKVLNKRFGTDMGRALLMADLIVVVLASFVLGIELGIYALLGVVFNGYIIDNMIEGLRMKVSVSIISLKSDEIKHFIVEDIGRGATIYTAKGAYTSDEKEIITSVMDRKEFIRLKVFVKDHDPEAFIMISNVREVLGEGFF
ncbi:YitT family protein [Fusibacter paucivorans]|uniref:YitT family protein n=1 Tax=Fusibacter paucivorans TaxID=76009 RepID=UPI0031B81C25